MYDIRNIWKQEPNTIREFVLLLLTGLVIFDIVNVSDKQIAFAGLLVSNFLGLIYVRTMSVSKDALAKIAKKPK